MKWKNLSFCKTIEQILLLQKLELLRLSTFFSYTAKNIYFKIVTIVVIQFYRVMYNKDGEADNFSIEK